jgi:hypothetical protein
MFCSEHPESVYGGTEARALGSSKTCAQVLLGDEVKLQGYTDLEWAGSAADMNTSWCYFSLGSSMISWFSRKHISVALSSTKEEYMAASTTSCDPDLGAEQTD